MNWNYRVIKSITDSEEEYTIRDVYHDRDGEPKMWSKNPDSALGGTLKELKADLRMQIAALEKPVLDEAELIKLMKKTGPINE